MIRLGNFNVVLDACILYDSHIRDLLLRLAEKELYQPIWSNSICEEVHRNLKNRIGDEKSSKIIKIINEAFPEALIDNYCKAINILDDRINEKDRHVFATAICANAQVIVNTNLKDFPNSILKEYTIEAQSPDTFLTNLFYLSFDKVFNSYIEMEKSFKNPIITREELFNRFSARTPNFCNLLKPYLSKNIIKIY